MSEDNHDIWVAEQKKKLDKIYKPMEDFFLFCGLIAFEFFCLAIAMAVTTW